MHVLTHFVDLLWVLFSNRRLLLQSKKGFISSPATRTANEGEV